jgi:hypothetical protein
VAEVWLPKLTRGLWGAVQGATSAGWNLAGVRREVNRQGLAPDAATLAHLYSRALEGETKRGMEADYRSRVQPDTYLARRPSGQLVARLPLGFSLDARWRQVVKVSGLDPLTGVLKTLFVNVQNDRLLTRGEAIGDTLALIDQCSPDCLQGPVEAEYESTWTES